MLGALAFLTLSASSASAKNGFDMAAGQPSGMGKEALLEGWRSFGDGWLLLDMCIVLLMALVLGAAIAYHPSTRRRMSNLAILEQPKTFLMYSMVAAVVALIVKLQPAMAFVIFGIGGLLRFRTMVGEAKDTGRVILVTVVGLCCGLKIFIVAIPVTILGWILIYLLEQQVAGVIRISGVESEQLREAIGVYRDLILKSDCQIIGEQTKFIKREFQFVVQAPQRFEREALQSKFDALEEPLRAKVDWEGL